MSFWQFCSTIISIRKIFQKYYSHTSYGTPWYHGILLYTNFGRLPLQSYCDDPYSSILIFHTSFERRGMKLGSICRNKSFVIAYALKSLRKIWKYFKIVLGLPIRSKILCYHSAAYKLYSITYTVCKISHNLWRSKSEFGQGYRRSQFMETKQKSK